MPVRHHRCLIIADSFYEWQVDGRHKIPLRITSTENNKMLCFAGVWDIWQSPKGQALSTFSIITTAPNREMSAIHNRMPAMLNSIEEQKEWLLTNNLNTALDLLKPAPDDTLKYYSISESINNVKNNSADLHLPVAYIKPPTLFD
jgi:putative SOS response-associated peptidase YedK